ncbi:unnamed protein product [Rhizophagus irregularis]|nr:unnamed protein product [Rhizophagus irregularis]CAB5392270.1 unnamed protein product [Rhizophagus irregularis]
MFINVSFSFLCDLFFKLLDVNFDVSSGGSGCGILFFNSFDRLRHVECFEVTLRENELLLCSIYQLQKDTNHSWYRIHPLSIVKSTSEVSFVHHCNSRCTTKNYEPSNYEYLQNNFVFTAI